MQQFLNKITQGNCLELIEQLPDESLDSCVCDPPYGENQCFEGDDPREAPDLLNAFLAKLYSKLKPNGHVAIFWTMRQLDVCIEAVKKNYTFRRVLTLYLPAGAARPFLGFLPRCQAIVLAQKYVPGQPTEFHFELSNYLRQKLDESGLTRSELARELGCNSRLVMKWTRPNDPAWCLPTPRFYPKLKELLKIEDQYDFLLTRQPSNRENRSDFKYHHDCYIVRNKKNGKMLHPSQKPLSVLEHIVPCLTPEGGIVLDAFAGSGTTAVAAKKTGRQFICFEVSEEFCEIAKGRLC